MKYTVVYEKSSNGFGAYSPDLPGLGVVGETLEETKKLIREGIEAHIQALHEFGEAIPEPTSYAEEIEVPIPA